MVASAAGNIGQSNDDSVQYYHGQTGPKGRWGSSGGAYLNTYGTGIVGQHPAMVVLK